MEVEHVLGAGFGLGPAHEGVVEGGEVCDVVGVLEIVFLYWCLVEGEGLG